MEGVMTKMPITTAKEKTQKRLEVKARSSLMMGIPNEHQDGFGEVGRIRTSLEKHPLGFVEKDFALRRGALGEEEVVVGEGVVVTSSSTRDVDK
ncbi:hypothetical protein Tco_0780428 [Tanacetum coccineum]